MEYQHQIDSLMIYKIVAYLLRIVSLLPVLFFALLFLMSCTYGPGTPGEGDTATQKELIMWDGAALTISICAAWAVWKLTKKW